jgi:hypothetical protein
MVHGNVKSFTQENYLDSEYPVVYFNIEIQYYMYSI